MGTSNFQELSYHVFKDYNIPFDEKGATYGTVRLVQWIKGDDKPDESKAKIEIRKMYNKNAEENTGKGYTFSTPEGPSELALGLIKAGFGDTKEILRSVRERDDFKEAVTTIDDEEDPTNGGEYFDMRDLLLSLSERDNDETA